jgi:AcrR family transcriptional regulator
VTAIATVSERRPITLETIAAAALAVLDGEGLAALTMRRLAAELHVEAPSLYHHVRGKDALLDLVAVHVTNQAPLVVSRARTPQGRIRDLVLAYREAMLAHPNVFGLLMQLRSESPGLLNSANAVLDELLACGLSPRAARERYLHCAAYVNGWIAVEVTVTGTTKHSTLDLPDLDTRTFLAGLELLLPPPGS